MPKVIRDQAGITHRLEAAFQHNTRCGQLVRTKNAWCPVGGAQSAKLDEGIVDCMACLAGPSHLRIEDLRDGTEVQAWVRLEGAGGLVGSAQPITFTHGVNVGEVIFVDLPVGVPVQGYAYLDEDGRILLKRVDAFVDLVRRSEGDTVTIPIGMAKIE